LATISTQAGNSTTLKVLAYIRRYGAIMELSILCKWGSLLLDTHFQDTSLTSRVPVDRRHQTTNTSDVVKESPSVAPGYVSDTSMPFSPSACIHPLSPYSSESRGERIPVAIAHGKGPIFPMERYAQEGASRMPERCFSVKLSRFYQGLCLSRRNYHGYCSIKQGGSVSLSSCGLDKTFETYP